MSNTSFKEFWKELSSSKKIQSYQIIERIIILSYNNELSLQDNLDIIKRKILKAFTPITNPKKIANGNKPYQGLLTAIYNTKNHNPCLFELFSGATDKENHIAIRDKLKSDLEKRGEL